MCPRPPDAPTRRSPGNEERYEAEAIVAEHIATDDPEWKGKCEQPRSQARMVAGSEEPYAEQHRANRAKKQARSDQG